MKTGNLVTAVFGAIMKVVLAVIVVFLIYTTADCPLQCSLAFNRKR